MTCTPAPACRQLLKECTARWPDRNKAGDGICASAAHHQQNPNSDHEVGEAVDVTNDPAHGCYSDLIALQIVAKRDKRVKYVISKRTIWRSYDKPGIPAWTPAQYTGPDPHTGHCHISIKHEARDDTSPWLEVRPMYDPPIRILGDIVDSFVPPEGGVTELTDLGYVYCWNGAIWHGGPAGHSYWGDRKAARFLRDSEGKVVYPYVVVDRAAETYGPDFQ